MTAQHVTYAHRNDPTGVRYLSMAEDPVPVWAVDVQPDDGAPKNWLGYPHHPTDNLLEGHHGDKLADMKRFRAAYDLIASQGPEHVAALEMLLAAAVEAEGIRQAEMAAGEDL